MIFRQKRSSLKPYLAEAIVYAHEVGLDLVVKETPLDYGDLPAEPIYTLEQLLDPGFPTGLNDINSQNK